MIHLSSPLAGRPVVAALPAIHLQSIIQYTYACARYGLVRPSQNRENFGGREQRRWRAFRVGALGEMGWIGSRRFISPPVASVGTGVFCEARLLCLASSSARGWDMIEPFPSGAGLGYRVGYFQPCSSFCSSHLGSGLGGTCGKGFGVSDELCKMLHQTCSTVELSGRGHILTTKRRKLRGGPPQPEHGGKLCNVETPCIACTANLSSTELWARHASICQVRCADGRARAQASPPQHLRVFISFLGQPLQSPPSFP